MPPRSRPRTLSSGVARVLTTALVPALLAGSCTFSSGGDRPARPSRPAESSSAPERPDLTGLTVRRGAFCDALPEELVTDALDGPVADTAHYLNGDEFEVRPGYVDVAHEYGCVYEAADGTAARVWVFARPVQRQEARTVVRRARARRDCAFPRALPFGSPGLTSVCELPASKGTPARVRARFEGLFGDTWVGCEVSEPATRKSTGPSAGPRRDVLQRADTWCVGVLTTVADSTSGTP